MVDGTCWNRGLTHTHTHSRAHSRNQSGSLIAALNYKNLAILDFKHSPILNVVFFLFGDSPASEFYRGADKYLARPGQKQATAIEGFDFHISYL
jgi:hypothetical protein